MRLCTKSRERASRNDRGQALAEAPIVVIVLCCLLLMLFQPIAMLYTKMVLGQTAASLCRTLATDDEGHDLKAYAQSKLEGLPQGSAFQVPGSLEVRTSGGPSTPEVRVEVSLKQRPLPLMGFLVGTNTQGLITVTGKASCPGTRTNSTQSPEFEYPSLGQH